MKTQVFFIAIALFAFVQAEQPEDGNTRSLKDWFKKEESKLREFFDKFQTNAKDFMEEAKKGGEEALKAAEEFVKALEGPCNDINKILDTGLIQKFPIKNIKNIARSTKEVCGLIINEGIPKNAEQLQKYIDALKGF